MPFRVLPATLGALLVTLAVFLFMQGLIAAGADTRQRAAAALVEAAPVGDAGQLRADVAGELELAPTLRHMTGHAVTKTLGRRRLEAGLRIAGLMDLDAEGRLSGELSFELTGAQRRALGEIAADIGRGRPMGRLLQGDVGSGKTAVAALALPSAAVAGPEPQIAPNPVQAPTVAMARPPGRAPSQR